MTSTITITIAITITITITITFTITIPRRAAERRVAKRESTNARQLAAPSTGRRQNGHLDFFLLPERMHVRRHGLEWQMTMFSFRFFLRASLPFWASAGSQCAGPQAGVYELDWESPKLDRVSGK